MVVAADDIVLKILLQTSDDDHRLYQLVSLFSLLQLQQGGSTRRGVVLQQSGRINTPVQKKFTGN